ncbi:MAG TPA: hypothetical protein DET40_14510 [Lentisphaeria bacterium]|nr:MAG: hypothetical protein A2X45_05685 [Lentisphaerae bacterium GWF2_50_93]HCE44751.1 hypothetical protein [Lentisphaeria bacterium]
MKDYVKKHTDRILILLLSACIVVNLLFCYSKGSLASTAHEVVIKGNKAPIGHVMAVDGLYSKLDKGKVFLRFEGFNPETEIAKRLVPLIYFRSVYSYYPGQILTGDPKLVIRKGDEFLKSTFAVDDEWLKQNKINYQITFIQGGNGSITTEFKEISKAPVQKKDSGIGYMVLMLFNIFLFMFSGYMIISLIFRKSERSLSEILFLSFSIGAGLMALISFNLLVVFPRQYPAFIFIGGFLVFCILVFLLARGLGAIPSFKLFKTEPLSLFSIVTIIVMFMIVCAHSLLMPLYEWDAFAIWGLKAKVIFHEGLGSGYFSNPNLAYSHLDYPLLVPFLMGLGTYSSLSHGDENACKLIFPFFYLAFVCLIYTAARWKLAQKHALLLTAIFASTPALVRWSGAGTADMVLSFFYAGSIFYLIKFFDDGKFYNLSISILFSSFCLFTKNEGLPLVAINICALFIFLLASRKLLYLVLYAAVPFILCAPWFIFSYGIPRLHENYVASLTFAHFTGNIDRLRLVIPEMLGQFLSLKTWGLIWLLMLAAMIDGLKHFKEKAVLLLWFLFLGHLLLYAMIYMIYPNNLTELIPQTIDRLYLHVLPAGVLIIIMHLSGRYAQQK